MMRNGKPVVVLAEPFDDSAVGRLREHARVIQLVGRGERQYEAIRRASALLVRHRTVVSRELIDAAPQLRVIGRGGVGLDNVDVSYAHKRGITVVYTPAAVTVAVAQHTLALLLGAEHKVVAAHFASICPAEFDPFRSSMQFRELHGCVLGVIGMGRIGSTVARTCSRAFGMSVLYNDIRAVGPFDFDAIATSKGEIYERADVITLHVPLTRDTRHMINAAALARISSACVLINTSRGAVVDTRALAAALVAGKIRAAALDVLESEPPATDDPILHAPNLLLTPHLAAHSTLGLQGINAVVDDVISVLTGHAPRYPAPATSEVAT